MSQTQGLHLCADGTWLHDGDRVDHPRLCALLHRSVALLADGRVVVTTGRDVSPFTFDDTPLRVLALKADAHPIQWVLSNEKTEPADARQLKADGDGSLRVMTTLGLWARLTRQAQLQLAPYVEDAPAGPRVVLNGQAFQWA